jgi:hypothetical protein
MYTRNNKSPSQLHAYQVASAALFIALVLSGCVDSPLNQTSEERSIAEAHASIDTRTWRIPDQVEIAIAQTEARRRWPEFVKAYAKWTPTPQEKPNVEILKKTDCFEVKIPVTVLFATEHIWMHVTALRLKMGNQLTPL